MHYVGKCVLVSLASAIDRCHTPSHSWIEVVLFLRLTDDDHSFEWSSQRSKKPKHIGPIQKSGKVVFALTVVHCIRTSTAGHLAVSAQGGGNMSSTNSHLRSLVIPESAIILNITSDQMITLNLTGGYVWARLQE